MKRNGSKVTSYHVDRRVKSSSERKIDRFIVCRSLIMLPLLFTHAARFLAFAYIASPSSIHHLRFLRHLSNDRFVLKRFVISFYCRTVYPSRRVFRRGNSFTRPNQYRRSRLRFRSLSLSERSRPKIIGLPAHFRELSILRSRRISSRIQLDRINTNAQVGARERSGRREKVHRRINAAEPEGNCIPRINLCRGCSLASFFPGGGEGAGKSLWNFSIYLCRLAT